ARRCFLGQLRVAFSHFATLLEILHAVEETLDLLVELTRIRVTSFAIERRGAHADRLELRRYVTLGETKRDACIGAAEGRREQRVDVGARMKRLEREQLEEDCAEGVDIRTGVERVDLAAHLLGSHVARRAENGPNRRHVAGTFRYVERVV